MASITIRNLDEQTKTRLRVRAAHHKRSMEEEPRGQWGEILSRAYQIFICSRWRHTVKVMLFVKNTPYTTAPDWVDYPNKLRPDGEPFACRTRGLNM